MESVSSAAGGSCCGMSPLVGSAILSLGSRRGAGRRAGAPLEVLFPATAAAPTKPELESGLEALQQMVGAALAAVAATAPSKKRKAKAPKRKAPKRKAVAA